MSALFERGSIGRVEILGLAIVHYTSAKGDHVARCINNGKHDAVAEKVIDVALLTATAQICCNQLIVGVSLLVHVLA